MKIYILNNIDQYNQHSNNNNASRTMLHTFGDNRLFVVDFSNQDRAVSCTRNIGSLKKSAADINSDFNSGRISLEEKTFRFRTIWIPLADHYISEYGLHTVPLDIRRSIADVRSSLDMVAVLWPAIICLDDEVGPDIIVLDNVDDFGVVVSVADNPS